MKMGKLVRGLAFAVVVLSAMASLGGKQAVAGAAKLHHVVGGDRGWDPASNLAAWSSGRTFRVGDEIWMSYSAAQGIIAELKNREEYESCDARNPIKMYTDGLHSIPLEKEGIRYFVSSDPENCKKGLKLHVKVLPMKNFDLTDPSSSSYIASAEHEAIGAAKVEGDADGPSAPSASPPHGVSSTSILFLIFCVSMMLMLHV